MQTDTMLLQARKMRVFADELASTTKIMEFHNDDVSLLNSYRSLRVRLMALSIQLQEQAIGQARVEHHQLKLDLLNVE